MSMKLYIEIMGWKYEIKFGLVDSKLLTMRFLRLLNNLLWNPSVIGKEIGTVSGRVTPITPEHNDSILFLLFYK